MQRHPMASCPACERINPLDAVYCSACGSPLVMRCPTCSAINVRSRKACHQCKAPLALPATAAVVEEPVVPVLTDDIPLPALPALQAMFAASAPAEASHDDGPLSLRSDLELPTVPGQLPETAAQALPLVGDADAPRSWPAIDLPDPATRKARRRARVRQAQMQGRTPAGVDVPRDVLVLEADAPSRGQLCQWLEAFGFRPHLAVSVAEAEGLSLRQPHVAAFLGLGGDALSAAELCRRLRNGQRHRPQAVIAIGDRDRHADRVRMELAGADAMLMRPVGRGDVARTLESCGVSLPRDPRQGAAPSP